MTRRLFSLLALFAVAIIATGAAPTLADEAGEQLWSKVIKAYRQTPTYHAKVTFESVQKAGRWKMSRGSHYVVAMDRKTGALLVDHPQFRLVADGKTIRATIEGFTGSHIQTKAPANLTYQALANGLTIPGGGGSLLQGIAMPDLVFLTARHPLMHLAGEGKINVNAVEPDAQGRPGLRFGGMQGTWTFRIDPATHLVARAEQDMFGDPASGEDFAQTIYEFDSQKPGQPIDSDTFAMDTSNSNAVDDLQKLIEAAQGGAAAGPGQAAAPAGPDQLQGQDAPAIALKTLEGKDFTLADEKAEVIILDFWATWCPPCRKGLPELQAVATWARKQKKSVAIYAVNLQEGREQVARYWQQQGFTMPVLMDTDGAVAQAYLVQGIPQTVLISNGKVAHVHVGFDPQMQATLKGEIERLIDEK